ncbi:hypothetical protein ACGFX4_39580 [Kitasatospora sp. NPDC048365]|uniref:hypothetical protein n=1 Tax=Kitasatospora sp. NPDC048365 TaxID=3364050 RepID=UPI0037135267
MYVEISRVSVAFSAHVRYYPREAWTLRIFDAEVDSDTIREELSKVASLDGSLACPVANSFKAVERRTDWGASSTFAEYMIEVSQGILSNGGSAVVGAAVTMAFNRIKKRTGAQDSRASLTMEGAADLVRRDIERLYDEPTNSLTITASSFTAETNVYEFTLTGTAGTYRGTVGELEEQPACTHVWFTSSEDRPRN